MSKEKNPIRNTAAEAQTREGNLLRLAEAMAVGGSQSIYNEEARGQRQVAATIQIRTLPICRGR